MARFMTPSSAHTECINSEVIDISDDDDEINLDDGHQARAEVVNIASHNTDDNTKLHFVPNKSSGIKETRHSSVRSKPSHNCHNVMDSPNHTQSSSPGDAILNDIFTVDGQSYDAYLYQSHITLELIGSNRSKA